MRLLYIFLFLTIHRPSIGQKNPFSTLKFDKVIFYDFRQSGEKGTLIIDKSGKYLQTVVKQVQLDTITIKQLVMRLGDKKSYGNGTASCFDPHCGFVYYFQGKAIAQITICLGCNRLYSTIDIPAQEQCKQGKGKDAYYILDGLSKPFRQYINGLLIKYNFSHQIENGSHFDE